MKHSSITQGRVPAFKQRFNELITYFSDGSSADFARFLGMTRQTVGFYANGSRIPDAETIIKICTKCEVSADWLLGLSDTKTTDPTAKAAVEYTGLSENACERLHGCKSTPHLDKAADGVSLLIEKSPFLSICKDILDAQRYVVSVSTNTDYPFIDKADIKAISQAGFYLDFCDEEAEIALMEEIISKHPELKSRISINCGKRHLDWLISRITDSFKVSVESAIQLHELVFQRHKQSINIEGE